MSNTFRQNGFTLLELQISLLIFTSLLLFTSSTIFMSTKIINSVDTSNQKDQILRITFNFLQERINSIEAVPITKNNKRLAFYGNENELLFIGKLPNSIQSTLAAIQRIYLKSNYESYELLYAFDEHNDNEFIETSGRPELLSSFMISDQINSIKLSYYGKKTELDIKKWHSNWENLNNLPIKIKVSLEHKNNDYAIEKIIPLPTHLLSAHESYK